MTKLLSTALMIAAVLTTPAMARQGQLIPQRLTANARITTTAPGADCQIYCRNRAIELRGLADRDVWGHWGAYYGPMVHAP